MVEPIEPSTLDASAADPVKATGRRRWIRRILILAVVLLAADLVRPPADQLTARFLVGGIHLYQRTLSPLMPSAGVRCRFKPTCSRFGAEAIRRDGALVGGARTVWRIARCGPWTPVGTVDEP